MALRSLATLKQAMNSIDDILFNRFSELEPMDFGREFTTMLRQILAKSPRERWSIQSLVYDLWKEYFLEKITIYEPPRPRPSDFLHPGMSRSEVEVASILLPRFVESNWEYAIRCVDAIYNKTRKNDDSDCLSFGDVLSFRGVTNTLRCNENSSVEALHARLKYLESRIVMLDARDADWQNKLRDAERSKQILVEENKALAVSLSLSQDRVQSLQKTFNT